MARKSRWMQFTENFNAMNKTMNDAFKKYDISKLNEEEFLDPKTGLALEGNALASAKNERLANIYEKYGDAEGALGLRTKGAELQGLMRQNRIGDATEADQIYVQGAGARKKLDTTTAASEASTRLNNLQADAAEQKQTDSDTLRTIMSDVSNQTFENQGQEDAYLIQSLKTADLPPEMKNSAMKAVTEFGSGALAMETARITRDANKALKGGLPQFTDWYNNEIADGYSLEISDPDKDGNVVAYAVRGQGEDAQRSEIARGTGEGANMQILNSLYGQVKDPGNIMGAAVENLAYRKSQVGIGKTVAETANIESEASYRDGPQTDLTNKKIEEITSQNAARESTAKLNDAQVKLIAEKISTSEFNRDPNRPMTSKEVTELWSETLKMLTNMEASEEEIKEAKRLFKGNISLSSDFTVRPKQ